jgi:hypothetical protein
MKGNNNDNNKTPLFVTVVSTQSLVREHPLPGRINVICSRCDETTRKHHTIAASFFVTQANQHDL